MIFTTSTLSKGTIARNQFQCPVNKIVYFFLHFHACLRFYKRVGVLFLISLGVGGPSSYLSGTQDVGDRSNFERMFLFKLIGWEPLRGSGIST